MYLLNYCVGTSRSSHIRYAARMGNHNGKNIDIETQNSGKQNAAFQKNSPQKVLTLKNIKLKDINSSKRKGLQILQEIDSQYNGLTRRFSLRKKTYLMAYAYYHRLNLFLFIIPLMLIQVFVASSPLYLKDTETSNIHSIISSSVAAASALWIGLQTKLKWAEYSEKYQSAGHLYTFLLDATWYRQKIFHIDVERVAKPVEGEEDDGFSRNGVQFLCSDEDCKKHFLELQKYMRDIEKLEKNTMDNTPLAPLWIAWHMQDFMKRDGKGGPKTESSFTDAVQS